MTGLNKAIMMRPVIIQEDRQVRLSDSDYEWVLTELDGPAVSFSSLKNKAVFLSFWATWCPPCRAELPNIQRLYDEYGDRLVMVLASHEEPAILKSFLEQYNYTFPVYRLVQNPPEVFRSGSIPTSFLITPDGRISVKKTGAARWDGRFFTSYIDELME
jgi:thiol-disulfide isomerase/thioredoxin